MQMTGKKSAISCSIWKDKYLPDSGVNGLRCLRLFIFSVVIVLPPASAQVYKWVDKNGKTHYGDKAPGKDTETLNLQKQPQLDEDHESRTVKQRRLLEIYSEERAENAQRKAEIANEKLKRKTECQKARKDQLDIAKATFLYKKSDDPNNPIIYSEAERAEASQRVADKIKKWCD